MAQSMTGYGRATCVEKSLNMTIEIKSVNHRYCDVQTRMPRTLFFLDAVIRERVAELVGRGKVDVYIQVEDTSDESACISINDGLAMAYSEAISRIAEKTGRDDTASAGAIARLPDVILVQTPKWNEKHVQTLVMNVLDQALNMLQKTRQTEGDRLADSIVEKVGKLEVLCKEVEKRAPQIPQEYKKRLEERLAALLDPKICAGLDDARKETEVAMFADKCSIDEELVRLESHTAQMRTTLMGTMSVGKKMDFLLQEAHREVNTIGSKANDLMITTHVVEMKALLEIIREQVQNLA